MPRIKQQDLKSLGILHSPLSATFKATVNAESVQVVGFYNYLNGTERQNIGPATDQTPSRKIRILVPKKTPQGAFILVIKQQPGDTRDTLPVHTLDVNEVATLKTCFDNLKEYIALLQSLETKPSTAASSSKTIHRTDSEEFLKIGLSYPGQLELMAKKINAVIALLEKGDVNFDAVTWEYLKDIYEGFFDSDKDKTLEKLRDIVKFIGVKLKEEEQEVKQREHVIEPLKVKDFALLKTDAIPDVQSIHYTQLESVMSALDNYYVFLRRLGPSRVYQLDTLSRSETEELLKLLQALDKEKTSYTRSGKKDAGYDKAVLENPILDDENRAVVIASLQEHLPAVRMSTELTKEFESANAAVVENAKKISQRNKELDEIEAEWGPKEKVYRQAMTKYRKDLAEVEEFNKTREGKQNPRALPKEPDKIGQRPVPKTKLPTEADSPKIQLGAIIDLLRKDQAKGVSSEAMTSTDKKKLHDALNAVLRDFNTQVRAYIKENGQEEGFKNNAAKQAWEQRAQAGHPTAKETAELLKLHGYADLIIEMLKMAGDGKTYISGLSDQPLIMNLFIAMADMAKKSIYDYMTAEQKGRFDKAFQNLTELGHLIAEYEAIKVGAQEANLPLVDLGVINNQGEILKESNLSDDDIAAGIEAAEEILHEQLGLRDDVLNEEDTLQNDASLMRRHVANTAKADEMEAKKAELTNIKPAEWKKLTDAKDVSAKEVVTRNSHALAALRHLRSIQKARKEEAASAEGAIRKYVNPLIEDYKKLAQAAIDLNNKVIPGGVDENGNIDQAKFLEFCEKATPQQVLEAIGKLSVCMRTSGTVKDQFPMQELEFGKLEVRYQAIEAKYRTKGLDDARENAGGAIAIGIHNARYALEVLNRLRNVQTITAEANDASEGFGKRIKLERAKVIHSELEGRIQPYKPGINPAPPVPQPRPSVPQGGSAVGDEASKGPGMLKVPPNFIPPVAPVLPIDKAERAIALLGDKIGQAEKISRQKQAFDNEFDQILRDTEAARQPLIQAKATVNAAIIQLDSFNPAPSYDSNHERAKAEKEMQELSDEALSVKTGFMFLGSDAIKKYTIIDERIKALNAKVTGADYGDYAKSDPNVAKRVDLLKTLLDDSETIADNVINHASAELVAREKLVLKIQETAAPVSVEYGQLKDRDYLNTDQRTLKALEPAQLTERLQALNTAIRHCVEQELQRGKLLEVRKNSTSVNNALQLAKTEIKNCKTEEEAARRAIMAALTAQAENITAQANNIIQAITVPAPPGPPGKPRKEILEDAARALGQHQDDFRALPDPNKPPVIPNDPYIPAHGTASDALDRLRKAIDDANRNEAEQEEEFTLSLDDYLEQAKRVYDNAGAKDGKEMRGLSDDALIGNAKSLRDGALQEGVIIMSLQALSFMYPTVENVEARVAAAVQTVTGYIDGTRNLTGLNLAKVNIRAEDDFRRKIIRQVESASLIAIADYDTDEVKNAIQFANTHTAPLIEIAGEDEFNRALSDLANSINALKDAIEISDQAVDDLDAVDLGGLTTDDRHFVKAADDHKKATAQVGEINRKEHEALDALVAASIKLSKNAKDALDPEKPETFARAGQLLITPIIPSIPDNHPRKPELKQALDELGQAMNNGLDELIEKHKTVEQQAVALAKHAIGDDTAYRNGVLDATLYLKNFGSIDDIDFVIERLEKALAQGNAAETFFGQQTTLDNLKPLYDAMMAIGETLDEEKPEYAQLAIARLDANGARFKGQTAVETARGLLLALREKLESEQAKEREQQEQTIDQIKRLVLNIDDLLRQAKEAFQPVAVILGQGFNNQSDTTLADDYLPTAEGAESTERKIIQLLGDLKRQFPLAQKSFGLVDDAVKFVRDQYIANINDATNKTESEQEKRRTIIQAIGQARSPADEHYIIVDPALKFVKQPPPAVMPVVRDPAMVVFLNGKTLRAETRIEYMRDLESAISESEKALKVVKRIYDDNAMNQMPTNKGDVRALDVHNAAHDETSAHVSEEREALNALLKLSEDLIKKATDDLQQPTGDPEQDKLTMLTAQKVLAQIKPLLPVIPPNPAADYDPIRGAVQELERAIDTAQNDLADKYRQLQTCGISVNERVIPEELRNNNGELQKEKIKDYLAKLSEDQLKGEIYFAEISLDAGYSEIQSFAAQHAVFEKYDVIYNALIKPVDVKITEARTGADNAIELGAKNARAYLDALRLALGARADAKARATEAADKMRKAIVAADNFLRPNDPRYLPRPDDIKPQSDLFGTAVDEYHRAMKELEKDPVVDPLLPPGEKEKIDSDIKRVEKEFEQADLRAQFMAEIEKILAKAKESDDKILALGVLTDSADRDSIVDMAGQRDSQITKLMAESESATAAFEARGDNLADLLIDKRFERLDGSFKEAQIQIAEDKIVPYMELSLNVAQQSTEEDHYRNAMVQEVNRIFSLVETQHWKPAPIQSAIRASEGNLAQMSEDEINGHLTVLAPAIDGIAKKINMIVAIDQHASKRVHARRKETSDQAKEYRKTEIEALNKLQAALLDKLGDNERILQQVEFALRDLANLKIQVYGDLGGYAYLLLTGERDGKVQYQVQRLQELQQLAGSLLDQSKAYPANVLQAVDELNKNLSEARETLDQNIQVLNEEISKREKNRLNDTFVAVYQAAHELDLNIIVALGSPIDFSDKQKIVENTENMDDAMEQGLAQIKKDIDTVIHGFDEKDDETASLTSGDTSVSDHFALQLQSAKMGPDPLAQLNYYQNQLESAKQYLIDELGNHPDATRGGKFLPVHWSEGMLSENDHGEMIEEYIARINALMDVVLNAKIAHCNKLLDGISTAAHIHDLEEDDLDKIPYETLVDMQRARQQALSEVERLRDTMLESGIEQNRLDLFVNDLSFEMNNITAEMYRREILRSTISMGSIFFTSEFMKRKDASEGSYNFNWKHPDDRNEFNGKLLELTDKYYKLADRAIDNAQDDLDDIDDDDNDAIEQLELIIANAEASLTELNKALTYQEEGKVPGYLPDLWESEGDNNSLGHEPLIRALIRRITELRQAAEERIEEIQEIRNPPKPPRVAGLENWINQLLESARITRDVHRQRFNSLRVDNDQQLINAYHLIKEDVGGVNPNYTTDELDDSRDVDELDTCGLVQIRELISLAMEDVDRDDHEFDAAEETVIGYIDQLNNDYRQILDVMEANLIARHQNLPLAHHQDLVKDYYSRLNDGSLDNLDASQLLQLLSEFDGRAGIQNPDDPAQISTLFSRDIVYLTNLNNPRYPLELRQLNQDLNYQLINYSHEAINFRNSLNARIQLLQQPPQQPPYKPAGISIVVPPLGKQAGQAANIDAMINKGGKPAREINRLNIDALLYIYTKLSKQDREWVYQQLAGQRGHVHVKVNALGTFSLMLPLTLESFATAGRIDDAAILKMLEWSAHGYIHHKTSDPKFMAKEYGSHQRYANLVDDLSNNMILTQEQASVSGTDTSLQEQMREALFKRTSALKQERYLLDLIDKSPDKYDFDTPAFLEDEIYKAVDTYATKYGKTHTDFERQGSVYTSGATLEAQGFNIPPKYDIEKIITMWNDKPLVLQYNGGTHTFTADINQHGQIIFQGNDGVNTGLIAEPSSLQDKSLQNELIRNLAGLKSKLELVTAVDKDKIAVLERKDDVKYGDNASASETVFKLTMKDKSKDDYRQAWKDAEPLIITLNDGKGAKQYLVTADIFFHKASKRDRIGYYLKDVTGKTALQIDAIRDKEPGDKAISNDHVTQYVPKAGESLSDRIEQHIAQEVVNKEMGAPCIQRQVSLKSEETLEHARGKKRTP